MSSQQAAHDLGTQLALDSPDWDAVSDTIRTNAQAAIAFQDSNGNKILHIACAKKAPVDVVRLLVQQLPGEVMVLNDDCNDSVVGPTTPRCGQEKEHRWQSPVALGVRK